MNGEVWVQISEDLMITVSSIISYSVAMDRGTVHVVNRYGTFDCRFEFWRVIEPVFLRHCEASNAAS